MQHMTEANALENAPGQTGPAYVRWTMYDVRFGEFPRLRANLAPMYDFRCTTRTTAPLRAHAQRAAVAADAGLRTTYDVRRWQAGPAYVRGTMYDVRFGEFARRAAQGGGADAKRNF